MEAERHYETGRSFDFPKATRLRQLIAATIKKSVMGNNLRIRKFFDPDFSSLVKEAWSVLCGGCEMYQLRILLKGEDVMSEREIEGDWLRRLIEVINFFTLVSEKKHGVELQAFGVVMVAVPLLKEEIVDEILRFYRDLLGTASECNAQIDQTFLDEGGISGVRRYFLVRPFGEDDVKRGSLGYW
ncbi:hypothetical protein Dimus_002010 [Dionaea muscipula]